MAGFNIAAQMLGLGMQPDTSADQKMKKPQAEQAQKQQQGSPLGDMIARYSQAARDLLSLPGDPTTLQSAAGYASDQLLLKRKQPQ